MVETSGALKNIDLEKGAQTDRSDTPLVLALGNFDGVHLAHKALIAKAVDVAKKISARGGIFCFEKPPCDFLSPEPPKRICTLEQKLELAGKCGAKAAVLGNFPALRDLSPQDFIELLKAEANCIAVVCGYNFRCC